LRKLARKRVENGAPPRRPPTGYDVYVKFDGNITPSLKDVVVQARAFPNGKIVFLDDDYPRPDKNDTFRMSGFFYTDAVTHMLFTRTVNDEDGVAHWFRNWLPNRL
jgi:hypothetical protein